ncbi:hypothetical protein Agub_g7857, partial [Astrephomene gubernaculifera]
EGVAGLWGSAAEAATEELESGGAGGPTQAVQGPSLAVLLQRAALDPEFLNYRPSATAAALLFCHRLRRGDTPPWPAAVAALTGYADLEQPELAAAVGAVQRLIMEYSASTAAATTTAAAPAFRGTPATLGTATVSPAAAAAGAPGPPSPSAAVAAATSAMRQLAVGRLGPGGAGGGGCPR